MYKFDCAGFGASIFILGYLVLIYIGLTQTFQDTWRGFTLMAMGSAIVFFAAHAENPKSQ